MPENISTFSSVLELILNTIEAIALAVSIITFFYMMFNKFSKALRSVLAPIGFGVRLRIRALILCRSSETKKRAFIEYALLKTEGAGTIYSKWSSIIKQFKVFYKRDSDNMIYPIDNCTCLISEEFSEAVGRYFEYFENKKVRNAFGITDDTVTFTIKILIDEAYATPTFLLTGLLSQYEENWAELIKRYVSISFTAESEKDRSNAVLSEELYTTSAWLLWGPSFELNSNKFREGLCQLSFGDESNSIPAVADPESGLADKLTALFEKNQVRRYGALISPKLTLCSKKAFYKEVSRNVPHDNMFFYDKLEHSSTTFAASMTDFTPCHGYRAVEYYCTAYIWVLFELEDGDHYAFRPETSVAFFEHTNIADLETYDFFVEMLMNKIFSHFRGIFGDETLSGRRYRYVCSMNTDIEWKFEKNYKALIESDDPLAGAFRERLIPTPKRPASEAFAAFDEFFSSRVLLTFSELVPGDKKSLSDLGVFYTDVYMECFPDENERESFDNLMRYLEKSKNADGYAYHILIARDESGHIIAGAVFDYFKRTNTGVIEFVAVKSSMQSEGIGTTLYDRIVALLSSDAFRMNKREKVDYIFCEIDSPENRTGVLKYLYFWHKHRYSRICFNYIQPSLSPDKNAVEYLWLIAACPDRNITDIPSDTVLKVVYDYMKYAMSISDPESAPEYVAMKEELAEKHSIPVIALPTEKSVKTGKEKKHTGGAK